jgi:hypothetical protein
VNDLEIDAKLRLAVAEVEPHATEAEGPGNLRRIRWYADQVARIWQSRGPGGRNGRPGDRTNGHFGDRTTTNGRLGDRSAAVTNSWLKGPNAPVALRSATLSIVEKALAASVLGFGGGGGDPRPRRYL